MKKNIHDSYLKLTQRPIQIFIKGEPKHFVTSKNYWLETSVTMQHSAINIEEVKKIKHEREVQNYQSKEVEIKI